MNEASSGMLTPPIQQKNRPVVLKVKGPENRLCGTFMCDIPTVEVSDRCDMRPLRYQAVEIPTVEITDR